MRTRQLLLFFAIVFAGTFTLAGLVILLPNVFGAATLTNPMVMLGVFSPSLTSLGLTAGLEGRAGLASLLRRLNPLGFHPGWYALVIVGIPSLIAGGMLLAGSRPQFVGTATALTAVGAALLFDPGPLGEELGWRGYALPRLLERFSPFVATLLLGVVWATWHVPAFFLPGMPQSELNLGVFYLGAVAVSMVMTWMHLHASGSILLAVLIHLMANHGGRQVGADFNQNTLGFLLATGLILAFARRRFFGRPTAQLAEGD